MKTWRAPLIAQKGYTIALVQNDRDLFRYDGMYTPCHR